MPVVGGACEERRVQPQPFDDGRGAEIEALSEVQGGVGVAGAEGVHMQGQGIRHADGVADLYFGPPGDAALHDFSQRFDRIDTRALGLAVTALDRSKPRLKRLEENLSRTGLSAKIIAADAETWRPAAPTDLVLLDAPCSALGTLRRHPEGAWTRRAEDIARFPDVQSRLLEAAHAMVRSGGTLVYCVCTPLRAEGADVVDGAVAAGLYRRLPIRPDEVPGFEGCLTPAGDVLSLPQDAAEHDAFFISRLTPM